VKTLSDVNPRHLAMSRKNQERLSKIEIVQTGVVGATAIAKAIDSGGGMIKVLSLDYNSLGPAGIETVVGE
jgi:hypothetical protein